jgi:hypothetical protein
MPKRFTVTEKWNDEWFTKLTPQAKVLWEYLTDNCDISGVFEINLELMRFRIRFSPQVDILKHIQELNDVCKELGIEDRIEWFTDKRRVWIRNFIKVQYGILSEKSSTHRGVMKALTNHSVTKGLPKGLQTLIGGVKVKNKAKVKYMNSDKEDKQPNIPFVNFWTVYDKKRDKDECEKKWNKLTDADRLAIMEYIPKYKKAQPIKQYRKDPKTFLNNYSWKDEIIAATDKEDRPAIQLSEFQSALQRQQQKVL